MARKPRLVRGRLARGCVALAITMVGWGSVAAATASAATDFTWASGGTGNWSIAANWGGTAPAGTVGTLSFPATACTSSACPSTNDDVSGLIAATLSIVDPSAPVSPPWQPTGSQPLTLTSGLTAGFAAPGASAFKLGDVFVPIVLGAANAWSVDQGGLNDEGGISGNQSLALNFTNGGGMSLVGNASIETGPVTFGSDSHGGYVRFGSVAGGGNPAQPGDINGTNGHGVSLSGVDLHGIGTVGALSTGAGSTVTLDDGAPGLLTVASATLDPTSHVYFPISGTGTSAGTNYSQISSTGAIALAGATLQIQAQNGSSCEQAPVGTVYTLVSTTGGLTGAFGNAPENGLIANRCGTGYFRINYHETGPTQTVTATAVESWTGGAPAGQGNWSNGLNWASGTAQTTSEHDAGLVFPALSCSNSSHACYLSTNDVTGITADELALDGGDGYALSGDGITLGSGGLSTLTPNQSGNPATIGMPITLGAAQTWTLDNGPSATAPQINDSGGLSGSPALTLDLGHSAALTLSGNTNNELGNVTVAGANTTSTGIAAATNGALTLGSGAQLDATDANSVTVTDAELISDGGTVGPLSTTGADLQVGRPPSVIGSPTPTGSLHATSATLDPTTAVRFQISGTGTTAGTDYGQLTASGAVNLAGATLAISTCTFSGPPVQPAGGSVYTIVSAPGGLTGTFGNAANGSMLQDACNSSVHYQISYTASTVTATVPVSPPVVSGGSRPSISGAAQVGSTLMESHAAWNPNPTTYAYQWFDCDSAGANCTMISGAVNQSYPVVASDAGHTIVVQEIAYNGTAASQPVSSAATGVVPGPPSLVGSDLPQIEPGQLQPGSTLSEFHGNWTPTPTGYVLQWEDCDASGANCTAISGANGQQYTLTAADVGHTIRVQETASDAAGPGSPATTLPTAVITEASGPPSGGPSQPPTAPASQVRPIIAGTAQVGRVLRGVQGSWSGTEPISYHYQWSRCTPQCSDVPGATRNSYPLTSADLGARIGLVITATNSVGSASATAASVGPVIAGSVKPPSGGGTPPCTAPSGPRDPANPLALATAPGSNPLHGAPFFVDGPAHGAAAGEIARLLGIDASVPIGAFLPGFGDSLSWQTFLDTTVATKLPLESPAIQQEVELLEKIASEPEAQRFSVFAAGGTPSGLATFGDKLFCHNFTADPGSVPIITTYFMHPVLFGCSSTAQINAYMPLFKQRVDAVVRATGDHRAVYLLELDAVGSSSCMAAHHSLPAWEHMLRYEVDQFATLKHAVVYVEGGYSDANTPGYAAKMLNAVDIKKIRGFFTNDTHINWTINEIRYGNKVSKLTHGAHFIVNTAQNGNGPLLNPHPTTQGVEDLCNPPGRGLGPRDTTATGYPKVDAFLWTHMPGNSSGSCHGGPASGAFWPARAIQLAANANSRLGPNFPSQPY